MDNITWSTPMNRNAIATLARWDLPSCQVTLVGQEALMGIVRVTETGCSYRTEVRSPFKAAAQVPTAVEKDFYAKVVSSQGIPVAVELCPRGVGGGKLYSAIKYQVDPIFLPVSLNQDPKTPEELVSGLSQLSHEDERVSRYFAFASYFIKSFSSNPVPTKANIDGLVTLVLCGNQDITHSVINQLTDRIRNNTLLNIDLVLGLADAIDRANPQHLNPDDLIQVMLTIVERISKTHTKGVEQSQKSQLKALIRVLNAMVDVNVCDLPRDKQEEIKALLGNFSGSDSSTVQCLAVYAQEALKRVPNDETKLAAFLRVSVGLVKGVYYFYSAVSKIDPGALVDGFFSFQESAQGIMQFAKQVQENFVDALPDAQEGLAAFGEGLSSLSQRKLTWYDEIRYVEMLIASNSFEALEMFLFHSRLRKEPTFISVLVEKLHEVAVSHPIPLVRNETLRLMQNLYQNDRQWNDLTFKEEHFKNEGPGKMEVLNRDSIRVWIGIKGNIVSQMESYQRIPELKSTASKVLEAVSQRASGEEQAFIERRRKGATQITPKKTSQTSLFPPKSREEFSLEVKLEKMRSSIVEDLGLQQEKPFYVSPRGTFYPGSNTTFDLIEEVEKFLEGSQKVLLLQGDSGTGKTLFAKLLSERLWTRYKPGKGKIPFYVALPTIKEPSHNLVNEAAQRFSFTLEDIAKIKDSREIIWILDGYDEIPAHTDILEQNGLTDSKVIVLCRSEALPLTDMFIPIVNGKPKKSLLRELHLSPFSQAQIGVYIRKCIELGNAEWKEVGTYRKMIEEIEGLSELVQNPFILKIIVDTLPEICDQVKNIDSFQRLVITRHALYKAFTEEWFQKGFIRAKKNFAKLKSHGLKPDALKKDAHAFCVCLANEMQLRGATHLQYATEAPDSTLESLLGEDPKVALLRTMAPLKVVGEGAIAFLHKSLQEYFIAVGTQEALRAELIPQHQSRVSAPLKIEEAPLQSDSSPVTFAIEPKAAGYAPPPVRPLKVVSEQLNPSTILQNPVEPAHKKGANIEALRGIPFFDMLLENSVWLFLADVSKSDTAFQTQLLEVIKASKTDESYATASANAMSVLNLAGFSFSGIDLSGIRAPGAYLAYGNFFGTDLRKAQIPRANLTGAVLSNAHFEGANMEGVKLGQLPLIQLDDEVYRLLLTKDGKRLICSAGYNIRILDIASGKEIARWTGTSGMKAMLLFDNDRKLVTGSTSNYISLWDISTGREIKRLVGHKGWVFALTLLDNGKKIVSGSWDQTIRIWESETGEQLEVLTTDSHINALIALPNDRSFVAGSAMNGELKIWNSETGTVERRLIGHSDSIDALAVLGDEGKLASGGGSPKDYTIRIWETNTGEQITVFEGHTGCVVALTALERGKKLASASWDATIRVWDVELGQQLQKFEGHTGFPNTIVPLGNGNTLASAGKDKTIRFWKLQEEIGPKRAEWNGWVVYCLTLVDEGKQLASAGGGKAIFLHDIKSGKELGKLRILTERDPDVHTLVSFDRGRKLASAGQEAVIRIWDVSSKQLTHLLSGHTKSVYSIALLDQKTLASASEDNSLRIWNIATGQALKTLSNSLLSEQSVRSFSGALTPAITPLEGGKKIGLMLHDRTWREFDTESAQETRKTAIRGFDGNVRMIGTTVSLGIKKKIVVGRKGYREIKEFSICIIDPETGDELRKLIGNQTFLTALAAIEPGAKLVSAAEDRTIRIYDILSSKELCKIGCPFEIQALHFQAPDLLFAGDKRGSSGGSNSQGALWCWQLDFKAEGLNPKLLWCTRTSFETSGMKIKGVSGLSAENRRLFVQHGAEE